MPRTSRSCIRPWGVREIERQTEVDFFTVLPKEVQERPQNASRR